MNWDFGLCDPPCLFILAGSLYSVFGSSLGGLFNLAAYPSPKSYLEF